ncbi:hypothetical protein J3B00_002586 [Pseudomonas sp. BP8]|nr:hypothetical protein [Pseudomonas sp. BP8]
MAMCVPCAFWQLLQGDGGVWIWSEARFHLVSWLVVVSGIDSPMVGVFQPLNNSTLALAVMLFLHAPG